MDRYIISFWGSNTSLFCLFDTESNVTIGPPITSEKKAIIICKWYNQLMKDK